MWSYEKRLQFPVRIKTPNAAAAKVIITQYGGPDGDVCAHKGLNQNSPVFRRFEAIFLERRELYPCPFLLLPYALQ